ncbi:MAG: hypothetical protein ABIP30_03695 [Ferruginibacter sp.]
MKKIKFLFLLSFIFFTIPFTSNAQDGTVEAINQMGEDGIQNIQDHTDELTNISETMSGALGSLNTYLNIAQSAGELYNATHALDNNECQPDFTTSSQAMMPTHCVRGSECFTCYQSAVNELTFVRRTLARLWCIYSNTKNFNSKAVAFGDDVSGVHAINGLAWQYAKADINAAYESFKHTYDAKYMGLMGTLDKALHDISNCEARFGEQDWYQKFGFIYFEFMKDKYKRND